MTWRRADVILAVVAVVVTGGCLRLGIWQLDRLSQRRARNAAVAARLALSPITLHETVSRHADSLDRRRIVARGVFDYDHERVWPARSFDGTPGVALVTPLRLGPGIAVYVDRGWVPSPDAFTVDQAAYREGDTVEVAGVAFVAPRGRADVDPQLAGLPYDLLPVVVQQERPEAAGGGLPRRWPTVRLDNGPHLFYAIQWFSFAAIALVGTALLLRKSPRARDVRP